MGQSLGMIHIIRVENGDILPLGEIDAAVDGFRGPDIGLTKGTYPGIIDFFDLIKSTVC